MKKVGLAAIAAVLLLACNDASTNSPKASGNSTKSDAAATNTTNSEQAKQDRNKQTALASEGAFSNGNGSADAVFKDADKDFVEYGDGSMKPIKGVDSAKAFLNTSLAAIPDYKGSDFTAVAEGDKVMVYGTWQGTWKKDLMGQKATGKSFKVNDVDYFTFNDAGKITEHWSVQSMNEIAQQIGMKMPKPTP